MEMKMKQSKKRDIQGSIVAFCLGVLLSGLGTIIMVLREVWQSETYDFELEKDDVVRYSILSSIGAVVNLILLLVIT